MAWVRTREQYQDRTATVDKDGNRQYQRRFIVQFDSLYDGPGAARGAPDIPAIKATYVMGNEFDIDAYCTSIDVSPHEGKPYFFAVTCKYTTDVQQEDRVENPVDRPLKWDINFNRFEKQCHKDKDGTILKNTAGDRIKNIVKDDSRPLLHVSYASRSFDSLKMASFRDTVNDADWGPFPARTCKMLPPVISNDTAIVQDQRFDFLNIDLYWELNEDTWDHKEYSEGLREKVSGTLRDIMNKDQVITEPWFLDSAGKALPFDGSGTPYELSFKLYNEKDFSIFGTPPASLGVIL